MLEAIQNEEYGVGTVDFNKIIPMPESLDIEEGNRTKKGLRVYVLGRKPEDVPKLLENIPPESEQLSVSAERSLKKIVTAERKKRHDV